MSDPVFEISRLPGGLTVVTAEMPAMTSVCVGVYMAVGSRHEALELNGASHFIEHMVFKGTQRRTPLQISQAVEGIGGYVNAYTSEEHTCYYSKACHDRLDELVDVLGDMMCHSLFKPVEWRKEREVIKEEVSMYRDDPSHHVEDLLNATQFPDQPLGRPITGTLQTLPGLTRRRVLDFFQRHYVAGNTLISAAGHLRHEQVVRLAKKYFRHLPPGQRSTFEKVKLSEEGPRLHLETRKLEQTHLAWGVRTCDRHDPRRFPLRLANTIVGENMSSRLFQVVREERGLAYNINSSVSYFADTGDLAITAGLDADRLPKTINLVARELRALGERPPSKDEVRRARDYVIGQLDFTVENTELMMMNLGEQMIGYGTVTPLAAVKKRLSAVTPAQIQAVARDFFHPQRYALAMVGPLKKAGGLKKLLS